MYLLGHLTLEQKVSGSNSDPDTTDFSNSIQVFRVGNHMTLKEIVRMPAVEHLTGSHVVYFLGS